jgi:tryptophan-rich sensory protein
LGGNQAVTKAALGAVAICVVAAALEGLFAGRGVKGRLAQLRQPPGSPRFAVWVAIGLCYYAICFVVLSRLIASTPSPLRWAAFAAMIALLIGNAVWNLVFFRRKNVDASVMVLMAYVGIALAVIILLILVDPVSALVFLPYLLYLAYATWWLLSLRSLNREVRGEVD